MIDQDTLIVSYDAARGEPRGSRKRGQARDVTSQGDCIDCQLCVQVCPTGIDIRNGLQYECIGCAHCIDACAQVMERMGDSPDLIRYTTGRQLAGGTTKWLRPRSLGYVAVCSVLMVAFAVMLFTRVPFGFDVMRERGQLFHLTSDPAAVRNDYVLKVLNKSQRAGEFRLEVDPAAGVELLSQSLFAVPAGGAQDFTLQIRRDVEGPTVQTLELTLCNVDTNTCVSEETRFLGPASRT